MLQRQPAQRHQRRAAFTLMEMLVVVAIIVALAGIGGYFLLGQLGDSQKDIARVQVKGALSNACKTYYIKHNQFPPSLQQLLQKDDMGGPYLETADALRDPWGKPYQYDASGSKNGGMQPDIYTTAPSGEVIGNWTKTQ